MAARARRRDDVASPPRRLAPRGGAGGGAEPRQFTYDPDDPVPTIGGLFCAVGEMPSGDDELEPMWARLLNPALLLRNIMTPGPADQKESAEYFTAREPYRRLSERADVLVYETEPLDEPLEVTGRVAVELSISSSAVDTDFTAKLVDVYPPNEDYPEGYDLILNDTIIRTRYREGFDREVLHGAGRDLHGDDAAAADLEPVRARPPDPHRRLVVELPAARAQPEHRRADRPAHAPRRRRADGLRRHASRCRSFRRSRLRVPAFARARRGSGRARTRTRSARQGSTGRGAGRRARWCRGTRRAGISRRKSSARSTSSALVSNGMFTCQSVKPVMWLSRAWYAWWVRSAEKPASPQRSQQRLHPAPSAPD